MVFLSRARGTLLAKELRVRFLAMMMCVIGAASVATAEPHKVTKEEPAPPLWSVELSFGKGVEMGGGGEMTTTRGGPLTVSATVAIAIRDEPWLNAYGGMVAELIDRNAVGAAAGIQLPVHGTPLRLSGGATYMFSPFTLWGASAAVGGCARKLGQLKLCGDVELTAFFAGTDLAEGRTITQVQVKLGVAFDAL